MNKGFYIFFWAFAIIIAITTAMKMLGETDEEEAVASAVEEKVDPWASTSKWDIPTTTERATTESATTKKKTTTAPKSKAVPKDTRSFLKVRLYAQDGELIKTWYTEEWKEEYPLTYQNGGIRFYNWDSFYVFVHKGHGVITIEGSYFGDTEWADGETERVDKLGHVFLYETVNGSLISRWKTKPLTGNVTYTVTKNTFWFYNHRGLPVSVDRSGSSAFVYQVSDKKDI